MTNSDLAPQSPKFPAGEHVTLISTTYLVADAIASRSERRLPGISNFFRTRTIVVVGRAKRSHLGSFAADSWTHGGEPLHEIHLNADRRCGHATSTTGEDATVTLAHELAHLYAHERGIRDTSNRGRYHSKKFAVIARQLGCNVVRPNPAPHGFVTDRLAEWAAVEYRDLTAVMDAALRLHAGARPLLSSKSAETPPIELPVSANGKYVFARCQCLVQGRPRTLRMSVRQWQDSAVWCGGCRQPFKNASGATGESQPFWSSSPTSAALSSLVLQLTDHSHG